MAGILHLILMIFVGHAFGQHENLFYFISANFTTKASVVLRVNGTGAVVGKVDFEQSSLYQPVIISGYIQALTTGNHGFHIHRFGDMSNGCISAGPHFNPSTWTHGGRTDVVRHVGDLGNIQGQKDGTALVSLVDNVMTLHGRNNIIGRSLIVHAYPDDLGRGGNAESLISGNAGPRIACGVIGLTGEMTSGANL